MQSINFQGNFIQPAPASSKALIKLKNDKLIPSKQVTFQSGQLPINYQSPSLRPQIRFNSNETAYPNHISSSPSIPQVPLRRQGSNNSVLSSSQSFQQSQLSQSGNNPLSLSRSNNQISMSQFPSQSQSQSQVGMQQGQINSIFGNNGIIRNDQVKPLSAFLKTNHISTNGDVSRVRSSSASQFSFNNNESQRRITHLELRLKDFNDQILNSSAKLAQKERRVTELEGQLYILRQKSTDLQLKLRQIQEGENYKTKRLADLEKENKELHQLKMNLEKVSEQSQQKVKSLESSLDKILKSKNLQIQSLNQSCKQLSKHVELLQQKYEQQVCKHAKTMESHQNTLSKNELYFNSLNDRVKNYEEQKGTQEMESQQYIKRVNEQHQHIGTLENQNKTLKTELSAHIQQLEALHKKYEAEKNENGAIKGQLQRLTIDFNNAKKIGDQQIQFLQAKAEEGALDKERLLQEIQLTKAVAAKRNMVFQRQVIYELKQQNDRLWAKLIQKSDNNANLFENSPQYWNRKHSGQYSQKPSTPIPPAYAPNEYPRNHPRPPTPLNQNVNLENQYKMFIEKLEEEQNKASSRISELNMKEVRNNEQDVHFYKNKCINLEKMVQQHLEINLSLKQQLEKQRALNLDNNPSTAEITILKSELQKQQLLNQTLNRSFEIFKTQYEVKFKAAQKKVQQIEEQSKRQQTNNPNQIIIDMLKKQVYDMQAQIRNLTIENSNMSIKISQANRWQSLYLQLKKKNDEMSPIAHFKYEKQKSKVSDSELKENNEANNENLQREVQILKKMYKDKEGEIEQMGRYYEQRCEDYEKQLKVKEEQFVMLFRDFEKVEREFGNGKVRYDQLIDDINKLEQELNFYKSNASQNPRGSTQIAYATAVTKSKLLQILAFVRQLLEINKSKKSEQKLSPDALILVKGIENKVESSLASCSELESLL